MALDREDDVVRDHRRVQAQPLAFARQGENAVARRGRAAGREIKAVAHPGVPRDQCRTNPATGRRAEPRPRRAQHPARIVRAVRAEIGPQQRELHEVELRAAAADAFEFAGNRFERVDRRGEIAPLESGEAARHRRNQGTRGIAAVAGEFVDLPGARLQRGVVAGHGLRQRDVHVAKGHAGARERTGREIVHRAPSFGVARMPGEFPAPQKRDRVGDFAARRPAMDIGCEGFPEKPQRRRRVAGFEMAEREMPAQMAVQRAIARIGR